MLKLKFELKNTTKTCYRFENKDGGQFLTLYLKKDIPRPMLQTHMACKRVDGTASLM